MNELGFYLCLTALAITLANLKFRSRMPVGFFWCMLALCLSIVIRTSGFDTDINVYARQMLESVVTSYYLREPLIWMGHRWLYGVVGNQVYVFIITDVLLLLGVFSSFRRMNMPAYAYVAILLYFPFVMGIQNVYRQWAASCLILVAMSYAAEGRKVYLLPLIGSALAHNVSVVFWPAVFMLRKGGWANFALGASILMIPLSIILGAEGKSELEESFSMEYLYVACLVMIFLFCHLYLNRSGVFKRLSRIDVSILICLYTVSLASIFLTSVPAERVGVFAMFIVFPFVVKAIERAAEFKVVYRTVFILSGFMPVVLFSTRHFIMSGM